MGKFSVLRFWNPLISKNDIVFNLKTKGDISLRVFDITGALIKIVADGFYNAGTHTVSLNAKDLPSGVYFYKKKKEKNKKKKKMILQK